MPQAIDSTRNEETFDVIVVGAGFSGLYALHRLRDTLGLKVRVYESADDVGGTWYWNRYPGARCDIPSYHYSYAFSEELQQEWHWSEKYAAQPEILAYLRYVADKFDLRRDIRFETRVTSVRFDEDENVWEVETNDGSRARAPFFISAAGCLTAANIPDFEGRDSFRGETYFTGRWPHEGVDFSGKRVGIIGTGATAIQAIPIIAREAGHLTVFQRTPNYATPLRNEPLDPELERDIKANYPEIRRKELDALCGQPFDHLQPSALEVSPEERRRVYEECWQAGGFSLWVGSYEDLLFDHEANETAAEFVREKIRERVDDPELAEKLTPRDHPYGSKRQPCETGYYETFNRDDVTLVDLRETPLEAITPRGIRTSAGEHELDVIVYATGFDAFTGGLYRMNIQGRDGERLEDHWAAGPRTHLGLCTHGFPNLFLITGPLSPSVLFNMPRSAEQHVDWIADCIDYMRRNGYATIEADREAEDRWIAHVKEIADQTLLPEANSWYLGANVPGKPRVFMVYLGGGRMYREECDENAAKGYEGFTFEPAAGRAPANGTHAATARTAS
ncbi:FAD dependent oxidoreductase [Salinisphaera sp. PC39]|uniref:flavin-containing monooxygenase n=1 Tax=Salinisphaera sp. PC39 TaxID=1304156 RepID=UPI003342C2A9